MSSPPASSKGAQHNPPLGRLGGRLALSAPQSSTPPLSREQTRTMPEIARTLGVSRDVLDGHLASEITEVHA